MVDCRPACGESLIMIWYLALYGEEVDLQGQSMSSKRDVYD